ncbi:unnamed protein product, partial [Mesorhabditis spiculigera]
FLQCFSYMISSWLVVQIQFIGIKYVLRIFHKVTPEEAEEEKRTRSAVLKAYEELEPMSWIACQIDNNLIHLPLVWMQVIISILVVTMTEFSTNTSTASIFIPIAFNVAEKCNGYGFIHHRQDYTKQQKNLLQSFVAVGTLVGVSTALIPLANQAGFGYFLTARIIQGVAFAATSPLIGAMTAIWAPLGEHGLFLALCTGFTQLSNIFTMPVSGALCSSSWGWPAVYYVHAIVAAVCFTLFFIFYRDHPNIHPFVRPVELERIQANKKNQEKASKVPYKSIMTSIVIWGVWIAALGDLLSVQLVTMFNPQYMKDYLKYDILNTGFMAALPVIVQFAVKLISGILSDSLV